MDNPTTIFVWIERYGIATAFAVILLVYTLWQQATTQKRIVDAIEALEGTLVKVSTDLASIALQQSRQAEVLSSAVMALDRLQNRQERQERQS
jgi:hypothetical protein